MKIAAVVVTFNRLELLKQCIQSLRIQTYKLDEIIIINNSSMDGTLEWLNQQNDLTIITQENSGSAGGQHTGIKTAYEKGYDWILCTDDDTSFDGNYIRILMEYAISKGILFLGGSVINEKNELLVNHRGLLKEKIIKEKIQIPIDIQGYTSEIVFVQFISFVGMILNRTIIDKVGFPNNKFFYQHDDVEYCFRIKKYFSGLLVPAATMIHKERESHNFKKFRNIKERKNHALSKTKLFYDVRNLTFIVLTYYSNPFIKYFSIINFIVVQTRRIILYSDNRRTNLRIIFNALYLSYRKDLNSKKNIIFH
jgi:GT2 family glycosyltransferase